MPVANVVASGLVVVWVSPVFLHPRTLRRSRLACPHPFGKGRGGCTYVFTSEEPEAVLIEPTSLNRGEGLVARLTREAGGGEGKDEGEDGGCGGRRE